MPVGIPRGYARKGPKAALEERLAPSEILQQGARTIRERARGAITGTVDSLKEDFVPVAFASALLGALLAFRPTAADRRRRQAEEDIDRTWAALATAASKAKQRSQVGGSLLAEQAVAALRRAGADARDLTRVLRDETSTRPLGALVVLGAAAGVAALAMRATRARRDRRSAPMVGDGRMTPARFATPTGPIA